ncbi:MAG: glycosyltransferase family 2 protein [Ilumatobacteraceae bacterium]
MSRRTPLDLTRPLEATAITAAIVASVPSIYLGVLTVVASRTAGGRDPARANRSEPTRFAVCVPAHDEAANIADTVDALVAQQYPAEHFAVHVVADNCSDATASIAAERGATVHVRTDSENPGKGAALNWLTERLRTDSVDVVVIVDADTVADPEFLRALDRSFASGTMVAQAYYGVRDPGTSSTVGLRFAALACRHHLRPLARNALGASSGLYGNGMAFRTDVLRHRRWSNHLIEDAEFQMELLLAGQRVVYVPDAKVLAEMPSSLEAARSQSERWELGRAQLVRRFVPRLAARLMRGGPLPRRAYADAIADHLVPPLSLQALIDVTALGVSAGATLLVPKRGLRLALVASALSCAILVGHVLVGLRLVQAPAAVYRSLRSAPGIVLWKVLLLARIARRPADVAWMRTTRNTEQPTRAEVSA